MAGLGLELSKLFSKPGYFSVLKAYTYAGLIGCGPWLMAFFSLGLLGAVLPGLASTAEVRLFFVTLTFVYGITLIATGPIQVVLTRFAADQEFNGRPERVFPAFLASVSCVAVVFSLAGVVLFVRFLDGPLLFRFSAAMLMAIVAPIWIAAVFLTALKNYGRVLSSFAWSFGCTLGVSWLLASWAGISGAMLGVAVGHALLLLLLCAAVFGESVHSPLAPCGLLACFCKYWDLACCGLFYNLGIWIDKFLYWWADPTANHVAGFLYTSTVFDRVVYFSFLSIVPGMAVFLLKFETELSSKNRAFYDLVLKKGTLGQIEQAQRNLTRALRHGFFLLLKVQGIATGLLIVGTDAMLHRLGLGAAQASVFQMSLLGVFVLVAFLGVLTTLYYFDKRRQAMICCLLFLAVNGGVTLWTISAGERWYGFGLLSGSAVALIAATVMVNRALADLEYHTFVSQPLYQAP